ncbi:hypothetical protein F01_230103 [Burkholderia cenocepacia]|nr:hypothetical protein F01_230103 [Burkholderia cenocepacia]
MMSGEVARGGVGLFLVLYALSLNLLR